LLKSAVSGIGHRIQTIKKMYAVALLASAHLIVGACVAHCTALEEEEEEEDFTSSANQLGHCASLQ